jgi:hypothetical protein
MKIELRPEISAFGKRITEKIGDIKRGHTLQEEADVIRIIKDPSNISPKDIENYNIKTVKIIEIASFLSYLGHIDGAIKLIELTNSPFSNLHEEIVKDAQLKAKKWKLNLTA